MEAKQKINIIVTLTNGNIEYISFSITPGTKSPEILDSGTLKVYLQDARCFTAYAPGQWVSVTTDIYVDLNDEA